MNTRIAETIDARDHFLNKRTVTVTHEGHPPSTMPKKLKLIPFQVPALFCKKKKLIYSIRAAGRSIQLTVL